MMIRRLRDMFRPAPTLETPLQRRILAEPDGCLVKFDLGGIGQGKNGWRTVNLVPGVDVRADILDLGTYGPDASVDAFLLSHTYEHIPSGDVERFVKGLHGKLRSGGRLIVIQTDIKRTLDLYRHGRIDFFCLRDIVFTPIDRRAVSVSATGRDLMRHQFMWGAEELRQELLFYGFREVTIVPAGAWPFDCESVYPWQQNERYFGVRIPQLGIVAVK